MKAHRLASKKILDRRKIPVKKAVTPQQPPPQTAFRRRVPFTSNLQGIRSALGILLTS
jgi:hypothetical protein